MILLNIIYWSLKFYEEIRKLCNRLYKEFMIKNFDGKIIQMVILNKDTKEINTIYNYTPFLRALLIHVIGKDYYLSSIDNLKDISDENIVVSCSYVRNHNIRHIITDRGYDPEIDDKDTDRKSSFIYCLLEKDNGSQCDIWHKIKPFVSSLCKNNSIFCEDVLISLNCFENHMHTFNIYNKVVFMIDNDKYIEQIMGLSDIFLIK